MEFTSIVLDNNSPLVGKRLAEIGLRDNYTALIVSVERADGTFESPNADTVLNSGDNIWLVGDKNKIKEII